MPWNTDKAASFQRYSMTTNLVEISEVCRYSQLNKGNGCLKIEVVIISEDMWKWIPTHAMQRWVEARRGKDWIRRATPTEVDNFAWWIQYPRKMSAILYLFFSLLQIFGTLASTFWALINSLCIPLIWGSSPPFAWRIKVSEGDTTSQK